MARIRSVHPGLFTDEAFAGVSISARFFAIGIWTECDDQGVFEWKPVTLKIRLFPVDNVDISELLSELEAADIIRSFNIDGRRYGAVRNFGKWQRPKTPQIVHPCPDEIAAYTLLRVPDGEDKPERGTALGRMLHERQGGLCHYCRTEITFYRKKHNSLEIDHLIPVSRGGSDIVDNLAAACRRCNSLKATMTESEFREKFAAAELRQIHLSQTAKDNSGNAKAVSRGSVSGSPDAKTPKVEKPSLMEDVEGREGGKKGRAQSSSSDSELAGARDPTPIMPSLSDPLHRWMHLGDTAEVDEVMKTHPVVGGYYLDEVCRMACDAAGINDVNFRGDWRPIIAWLRDGIDPHETILPAIRDVASRQAYQPSRVGSFRYFDQAVRDRQTQRRRA